MTLLLTAIDDLADVVTSVMAMLPEHERRRLGVAMARVMDAVVGVGGTK